MHSQAGAWEREKMGKKSRPHMKKFLDNQGFKFD